MATQIEDKTFELITKNENFEFAFDLHSRFDSIKERLIQDFWVQLVLKFKKEFHEFKFTDRQGVDQHAFMAIKTFRKVQFYIEINETCFEYGIAISHNGTKRKIAELEERFIELFDDNGNDDDENTYYFYENGEEDFTKLFGLKKILPENRSSLIDKYILDFKKLYDSKQNDLIEFEETTK
jgi:hypothetical protein